jgi:hypothetical protein
MLNYAVKRPIYPLPAIYGFPMTVYLGQKVYI